ncbi:MAG TPA: hypothetical protein VJQ06_05125 [Rhizomicrobium sp.]|nr:hypothetical protein [Rhizomicrobium sp.]
MRRIIAILALCIFPVTSNAAPEESFRLYSDICFNEEGGDALGVRIGVIKFTEASYAFLQWSSGYPEQKPQMSVVSDPDLKRGKLVFSVQRDGEPTTFRGTITAKALTGAFSPAYPGDPKVFHLRRVPPLRKGFPNCV